MFKRFSTFDEIYIKLTVFEFEEIFMIDTFFSKLTQFSKTGSTGDFFYFSKSAYIPKCTHKGINMYDPLLWLLKNYNTFPRKKNEQKNQQYLYKCKSLCSFTLRNKFFQCTGN